MNTTQRKFAVTRIKDAAKAKCRDLILNDNSRVDAYNDIGHISSQAIVTAIRDGVVKPKTVLPPTHNSYSVGALFDLSALKEEAEKFQALLDKPVKVDFILYNDGKDRYSAVRFTCSYSDTLKELETVRDRMLSAIDVIMLGEGSEALEAIKDFEKLVNK